MNWTGGNLHRHSKANASQITRSQRKHFAGARLRALEQPVQQTANRNCNESPGNQAILQSQQDRNAEVHNLECRATGILCAESMRVETRKGQNQISQSPARLPSFEDAKRALLSCPDWLNTSAATPLRMEFTPVHIMERIGRHRRVGDNGSNNRATVINRIHKAARESGVTNASSSSNKLDNVPQNTTNHEVHSLGRSHKQRGSLERSSSVKSRSAAPTKAIVNANSQLLYVSPTPTRIVMPPTELLTIQSPSPDRISVPLSCPLRPLSSSSEVGPMTGCHDRRQSLYSVPLVQRCVRDYQARDNCNDVRLSHPHVTEDNFTFAPSKTKRDQLHSSQTPLVFGTDSFLQIEDMSDSFEGTPHDSLSNTAGPLDQRIGTSIIMGKDNIKPGCDSSSRSLFEPLYMSSAKKSYIGKGHIATSTTSSDAFDKYKTLTPCLTSRRVPEQGTKRTADEAWSRDDCHIPIRPNDDGLEKTLLSPVMADALDNSLRWNTSPITTSESCRQQTTATIHQSYGQPFLRPEVRGGSTYVAPLFSDLFTPPGSCESYGKSWKSSTSTPGLVLDACRDDEQEGSPHYFSPMSTISTPGVGFE